MYQQAMILSLYAETPVHAGTGATPGIVDLPIQRERHTQYPIIQGSGVKGVLRDLAAMRSQNNAGLIDSIFGPDSQRASEYAAAISVSDARILCFPVRSLQNVFVWATAPFALARLQRDAINSGIPLPWTPPQLDNNTALVASDAVLINNTLILEEFSFQAQSSPAAMEIARWIAEHLFPADDHYQFWKDAFTKRFVILPEDVFRDFVQHSTEIVSRTKLDDSTKTVQRGALWTEEYLPSDSLLYSTILATQTRAPRNGDNAPPQLDAQLVINQLKQWFNNQRIQIGGNATIGRGIVALRTLTASSNNTGGAQ